MLGAARTTDAATTIEAREKATIFQRGLEGLWKAGFEDELPMRSKSISGWVL